MSSPDFAPSPADEVFLNELDTRFREDRAALAWFNEYDAKFRGEKPDWSMAREAASYANFISGCLMLRFEELGIRPGAYTFHSAGNLRVAVTPVPAFAERGPHGQVWRITVNKRDTEFVETGDNHELVTSTDHILYPKKARLYTQANRRSAHGSAAD
jgi:hypothetical protein